MDGQSFFTRMLQLMADNPPGAADEPLLQRIATLGLHPGHKTAQLPKDIQAQLDRAAADGPRTVAAYRSRTASTSRNGWTVNRGLGSYGTDYPLRASVAQIGFGANLDADALYPHTTTDADGQPLHGAHHYRLHFPADSLPPVDGFWSLTMMNDRQFFADNPLDRYALGDRSNLRYNPDGSLDLHLQHDHPGPDREANWLPAPDGPFNVILRLYWPRSAALNGTWRPRPIDRVTPPAGTTG
ncbi:DUF1214 domain-containing protein [Kitasatospora paranensis]|uniref:DUF1214 domain-containing protein n=1 Tax=Kitasatospora paranensis TaxID=258053 RepID=A0ABW2G6D0_9ACTN